MNANFTFLQHRIKNADKILCMAIVLVLTIHPFIAKAFVFFSFGNNKKDVFGHRLLLLFIRLSFWVEENRRLNSATSFITMTLSKMTFSVMTHIIIRKARS
jgi:hypothetical protein